MFNTPTASVRSRRRFPVRLPHLLLVGIVVFVVTVAVLEKTPTLEEDFDPSRDQALADTWDKRIHIAYWEKWGSFERDACQAMVDAFNSSQDKIYVHYIRILLLFLPV